MSKRERIAEVLVNFAGIRRSKALYLADKILEALQVKE